MGRKSVTAAAENIADPVPAKSITAYKGFHADLTCSPNGTSFQFEIGKSYEVSGDIVACENGFHACERPTDVFSYYPAAGGTRYCEVLLEGDMDVREDKTAARKITVVRELTLTEFIKLQVDWTLARSSPEGETASGYQGAATASGTQGAATASGYQGAATASGYQGAATASGYQGAATASGTQGAATASGTQGAATASGYQGAATASGTQGAATASGTQGAATASGTQGAATASGTQGAATASGTQGAATASGYQGAATASGTQGAATASGTQGAATASGTQGAATASGTYGKASGKEGCALFLVERDDSYGDDHGKILHVWAGIVGENGIKADTFYSLKGGQPVEATE